MYEGHFVNLNDFSSLIKYILAENVRKCVKSAFVSISLHCGFLYFCISKSFRVSDIGQYECLIRNEAGETSAENAISVSLEALRE